MIAYGKKLARELKPGNILCLSGELGTGKTTLTKGIAHGLGIKSEVLSPTFTLMNVLPIKDKKIKNLVHIDTYRLKDEEELLDIGVLDYLGAPDTICIIEWPEKIKNLLKDKRVKKIKIKHSDAGRDIKII